SSEPIFPGSDDLFPGDDLATSLLTGARATPNLLPQKGSALAPVGTVLPVAGEDDRAAGPAARREALWFNFVVGLDDTVRPLRPARPARTRPALPGRSRTSRSRSPATRAPGTSPRRGPRRPGSAGSPSWPSSSRRAWRRPAGSAAGRQASGPQRPSGD